MNYAKEMKDRYPHILDKFTIEEVEEIWSSYSEEACASWLFDDNDTVAKIFSQAPVYFEFKKNNPRADNDYDNYSGSYYNWKNYYYIPKIDA